MYGHAAEAPSSEGQIERQLPRLGRNIVGRINARVLWSKMSELR